MSFDDKRHHSLILPRCLVMIFSKANEKVKRGTDLDFESDENITLFEDFIEENKGCFWDPHLEESLSSINIAGVIFPNTVFVTGRDIHLDTIRRAWSKRVLRSPEHYLLVTVGEIFELEVDAILQAQFTSLPDALCMIVADLNKNGSIATFDAILTELKHTHAGVHQPAEEVVYEALGTLIKERKLYHTGKGYHVITPDLFAHLNHLNGCVTLHGKQSAILMPYQTLPTAEMCSIACQTDAKQETELEEEVQPVKGRLQRSSSFREAKKSKEKKQQDRLTRSQSMRFSDERANDLLKVINSKQSAEKGKEKGEKKSVLRKIFGSKSKKSKPPVYSNISEVEVEQPTQPEEKSEVQLSTFSAQFPPPDMQPYSDQLLMMQPPNIYHMSQMGSESARKSKPRPSMVDADTQSEVDEWVAAPIRKSKTLPEKMSGFAVSKESRSTKTLPLNAANDYSDYKRNHRRSSSSRSPDSNHSFRIHSPVAHETRGYRQGTKYIPHNASYGSHMSQSPEQNDRDHSKSNLTNVSSRSRYSHHNIDVRPKQRPHSVNLHGNVNSSLTISEDIYESIHEHSVDESFRQNGLSRSHVVDRSPSSSTPRSDKLSPDEMFRHHFDPPHNQRSKPSHNNIGSNSVRNSSHKNRIYRRYRELCNTPTLEQGESRAKSRPYSGNLTHAQSCDSGVNCIGIPGARIKDTHPTGSFNHIEISRRSSIDLKNDWNASNPDMKPLHKPEAVKRNRHVRRGYSLDERPLSGKLHHAEIHDIPEHVPHAIEDSGFNSNRSANDTNNSYHTRLSNVQKSANRNNLVVKELKSNHNRRISRESRQNNLNQNGDISNRELNSHTVKDMRTNDFDSHKKTTSLLSKHMKENHIRKKMFLETDLDDTLESSIHETKIPHDIRNY